jgi:TonB-dependent starch-binding outer membrane protein SusC
MNKSIYCLLAGVVLLTASKNAIAQTKPNTQAAKNDSVQKANTTEAVNMGYLTVPKISVPGSVSIVKENRFKELAGVSIDALLQGQAAGVRVVNTSGAPGSGALTVIRGASTLNAGSVPLYIVDGVPLKVSRFTSLARNVDNNPLADINPHDIASVTILKDGHATAIYGMRGANGVVLISTYGGTSGKTYLDFSANTGFMQFPEPYYPILNANQYRDYILEKERLRPGITQSDIDNGIGRYLLLTTPANQKERYNNNTNWQKEALRTSLYNNYHLVLRGGDASAKYSLNVGYTRHAGAIVNTNFSRFSTRFNLDYKVGKKLSFLNTISYARTDKVINDEGNAYNTNPIILSSLKSPTLTSFQQNIDGENLRDLDSADYAGRNNPYAVINGLNNKTNTNRIMGRITGQYTFSPNLNLRIALAGDYYRLDETRYRPAQGFAPEFEAIRSSAAAKSYELMLMNENTLNYTKNIKNGRHLIDATIGTAYQANSQDAKTAVYINAPSDLFSGITSVGNGGGSNPQTDPNIDTVMSSSPNWKLISFFATTHYAFKNKYVFGANFRADGSSRFARGGRWGYFPSVAATWRISNESFMTNKKVVNDLRLRASFGISGNQEVGYYNSFNALVSAPYNRVSGIRVGLLGNRDFHWEDTRQFNMGADVELFKSRIALTVDAYLRETNHLFNTIKLPAISGFDNYAVSEGSVRNKGVELTLNGKILTGVFGWDISVNTAYNKNEILSLPEKLIPVLNYGSYAGIIQPGMAIGAFYGYNAIGVYARSSDVNVKNGVNDINPFKGGDIIFEDVDKNGIIDEKDRKHLGNVAPNWFGGLNNTFTYKGFDLNVFMDFSAGNKVFNAQRSLMESMSNYDNQSSTVFGRWKKEGDATQMPRALHGDVVGNTRFSSRWIEDGSYVRFKAITLGYNLPLTGVLKSTFKNARISLTAQNLYTFSKYKGYSPEAANVSNPLMYGVDFGNTPQMKTFLVGFKLGL